VSTVDDDAITALVRRLARPHASGGDVVERSAILAEGARSTEVFAWITAHSGTPETIAPGTARRGLHGTRLSDREEAEARRPPRYVLPPGTFA
jgi:hypothetical protein